MNKDIVLVADYHDENIEFRRLNEATGQEECFNRPNEREVWVRLLTECQTLAGSQGGRVALVMESTTGWARMNALARGRAELVLANVLQMPLPPKAHRRKNDKIDTGRILREWRNGTLPRAFQPRPAWRRLRRVVGLHVDLTRRQTALRNYLNRLLAHETWRERKGLWSQRGQRGLRLWAQGLPAWERFVVQQKLDELEEIAERLGKVHRHLVRLAERWAPARKLDAIRGLGALSATAIAACIGPIERFADTDALIAYAGLAPGVRDSDGSHRDGHVGGGGTDKLLRLLLLEATTWARQLPRYHGAYQRMLKRRGKKVARLHVARMLLRSIYAMLRYGREFDPAAPQPPSRPLPSPSGGGPQEDIVGIQIKHNICTTNTTVNKCPRTMRPDREAGVGRARRRVPAVAPRRP
jgi:transposase